MNDAIALTEKYEQIDKPRIRKLQAVLAKIENKQPVFFNVTLYKEWGLVRAHGRDTVTKKTNWVLTEKGKRILGTMV